MNRKDGRSIDWRWGSLIPLSADDGVYGDQNKSVKKARDDAKGKSAEIFSCSGGRKLHYFIFSFLSPIVFFVVSYPFYFACTFTSRLAHRKFGFQHFLYLFALRISCPVQSKLLRHSVSANGSVDRNQVGRRRERLVVRFFMGFVLFLHAVTDFGSWETGNGWNWCFCLSITGLLNLLSFWVGGLMLACSFFHAAEKLSSWFTGLVGLFVFFWLFSNSDFVFYLTRQPSPLRFIFAELFLSCDTKNATG